jgi:hypothetical protein
MWKIMAFYMISKYSSQYLLEKVYIVKRLTE